MLGRLDNGLPPEEVHDVLRNRRRRRVLETLQSENGRVSLRTLAEAIAAAETGETPPPRNIRQSVYNSLYQTHLPKLADLGLIEYDEDRKTVSLRPKSRHVDVYMEVVTPYKVTWAEFFQLLALLALCSVTGSAIGVPGLSTVSPLLLSSIWLLVLVVSSVYRLWSRRWLYLQQLLS